MVLRDFQAAARAQRASVEPAEVVRYEQYNAKHGARWVEEPVAAGGSGGGEGEGEEEDW